MYLIDQDLHVLECQLTMQIIFPREGVPRDSFDCRVEWGGGSETIFGNCAKLNFPEGKRTGRGPAGPFPLF